VIDDKSFADVQPRTWLDALPWLRGLAELDGLSWNELIEDTADDTRQECLARISELAMEHLTRWTIGQIFPGLDPALDLTRLKLPTRATNALERQKCQRAGDMTGMSLESILDWRSVGVGTVDAILQQLAGASTKLTPVVTVDDLDVPLDSFSLETYSDLETVAVPEWVDPIVEDISQLATWFARIGRADLTFLSENLPVGTPPEILMARDRLLSLTVDTVLNEADLELDAAALFNDALGILDHRAVQILAARLFADKPVTLDQLGIELGLTRERVRQIEGKARGELFRFISDDGPLAAVASSARDLISSIRPLDDLLRAIPALGKLVESVQQPAWRVLDRLDDAYEIQDGWCVAPSLSAAELSTQAQLHEHADQYGVIRLDELRLIDTTDVDQLPRLTAAWLQRCGYIVKGDHVLTRTSSVNDYGAAILAIEGIPLSAQEIVDRFAHERSFRSLANQMSTDERFERVDRDRWALKEWGMEAYAGIRSVIREQIARQGGRAKLSDLVEHITERYSVSASSVSSYAGAAPFMTKDGIVQLATDDQTARKAPERTRRLYRRPDAWLFRVRISTDHLRGSGFVAPHAIATLLALHSGETRQLPSRLGPQAIAWTGLQPQFGTIRRFLLDADIAADTDAFLVIHDDGIFDFEVAREFDASDNLAAALALVGAPPTTSLEDARLLLARAICLPDISPVSSVIGGYRERGDGTIADRLMAVRTALEAGSKPDTSVPSTGVDEILDLL
jgi:hypothetical protein